MRTETTTRELYTFDELDERAKERARDWMRGDEDLYSWHGENAGSLNGFCKTFGIDPVWEASLWGHTYCYPKYREYNAPANEQTGDEISGLRLRTYLLNNYGHLLTEAKPYGKYRQYPSGAWGYPRRSRILEQQRGCPFTGYCFDEYLLDPIRALIAKPDPGTTYSELLQACLDSWVEGYIQDWEYTYSDEAIDETIDANGYEFTKDGKIA